MKKYIIFFILISVCSVVAAQPEKRTDEQRIALTAIVPQQIDGISAAVQSNLRTKLTQIITDNGLAVLENQRFVITAKFEVLNKTITPTAPAKHAYTFDATFFIGDGLTGTLFSSFSTKLKGVGDTETKAYISAFNNLKTDDKGFKNFVAEGKTKIIEYYTDQCDFIIKEAEMLASTNNFEAAISHLVSVPQACKDCYFKSLDAVVSVYKRMIDRDCKLKLQQAKAIWAAGQGFDEAANAGAVLASIEPDAACFGEVKTLFGEIAARVRQIDSREWNYILKTQQQESERIQAMRAIGVAYGTHQAQNIQYKSLW